MAWTNARTSLRYASRVCGESWPASHNSSSGIRSKSRTLKALSFDLGEVVGREAGSKWSVIRLNVRAEIGFTACRKRQRGEAFAPPANQAIPGRLPAAQRLSSIPFMMHQFRSERKLTPV